MTFPLSLIRQDPVAIPLRAHGDRLWKTAVCCGELLSIIRKVDEVTGEEVRSENITKAYQISKGQYLEATDDELEAVAIESTQTTTSTNSSRRQKSMPKDMMDLAKHIVESKAGHFHPELFEDRYSE
jgi:non-homologous end joining protein Ku